MNRYRIVCREDASGESGLMFDDVEIRDEYPMVAHSGVVLAHDLVEHVNGFKYIGGLADEIMAAGAIWYVRGRWGDIRRDPPPINPPDEDLAHDLSRQADHFMQGEPLEFVAKSYRDVHDVDEIAHGIMLRARSLMVGSFDPNDVDFFFKQAKRLFIKGYNKAYSKYEHRGYMFANNLFWNVVNAVDERCAFPPFVGMEFELKVKGVDAELSYVDID